jgi:hypothetical protein
MVISNPIAGIEGIGGEEIKKMLSAIPPRPDYDTWMRIASAVWSVLGMTEGARLLHQWSPEEKEGEYAGKHKVRLKQVGIGTLINIAKDHGFNLRAWMAERAAKARQVSTASPTRPGLRFATKGERITTFSKQLPTPQPPVDMTEAKRIANELLQLHAQGVIQGPEDPQARIHARTIHLHPEDYGTIY